MNKIISCVIALTNIAISALIYQLHYSSIPDYPPSSKSWAEFFTFISCILFILNGVSLVTIINTFSKPKKYIITLCYSLIGIAPLAIYNPSTILHTCLFSITVITISISLITNDVKEKYLITINGLLLMLNAIWGFLLFGL